MLEYDNFSEGYNIKVDQGSETLPSKMGTVCSFTIFIVLIVYAQYKINILLNKQSVDILTTVYEDFFFDKSQAIGMEQGLSIAVSVYNPTLPST